jgi:uncharacterized protein with NRDE domain
MVGNDQWSPPRSHVRPLPHLEFHNLDLNIPYWLPRTNIRHPHTPTPPNAPSRGKLLKDFLAPSPRSVDKEKVHDYLARHIPTADKYEGFNLLLFDLKDGADAEVVGYLTNRPKATHVNLTKTTKQTDGADQIYGLSNSPMDLPFEKVEKGKSRMSEHLREWTNRDSGDEEDLIRRMRKLLSWVPIVRLQDEGES